VTVIVVNQGEQALLEDGLVGVAYTLRLFKTDVTAGLSPDDIDNLDETDFIEAEFTGYAAAALSTGDWTITQGNPTVARNVEKSFTSSANQTAQNVWGYYVTRDSDGALIWFDQFAGPIVIELVNDEVRVTPTLTLDDSEANVIPTGMITPFGGAIGEIPDGWRICYGQAISRTTFADLFNVIGTAYGVGDGSTTFNLPNLRGRFPLGHASSGTGSAMGETGGAIDHVHDLDSATSHAKIRQDHTGNTLRSRRKSVSSYDVTHTAAHTTSAITAGQTTGTELGGDTEVENPPYQVVNYMIKT
jgi:microcystin-dependent protein